MEPNDGDGFTLALELRDGVPVMILNGVELEPERAARLQRELGIVIKAAGMLAGKGGRLRAGRETESQPKAGRVGRSKAVGEAEPSAEE